jgi:hypothetical protein
MRPDENVMDKSLSIAVRLAEEMARKALLLVNELHATSSSTAEVVLLLTAALRALTPITATGGTAMTVDEIMNIALRRRVSEELEEKPKPN